MTINKTIITSMKQIVALILAVVFAAGCSNKENFIVKGNIENAKSEQVYLYRIDLDQDVLLDSIKIKNNGNFQFKLGRLAEPTFLKLALSPRKFITLLGDSTETIEVIADKASFTTAYTIRNSIGSKHIQMLNQNVRTLRTQVDSLISLYENMTDAEKSNNTESITEEINKLITSYKDGVGSFVMENPRSFASYYALFLPLKDESLIMNVYDKKDQVYFATVATSLNLIYPEAQRTKHLYDMVLGIKAWEKNNQRLLEMISQSEVVGAPDIKAKNVKGEEIALSSLKGKVVLLQFGASWDEPSVNAVKGLKSIYKKYKDRGFEIYQVSMEQSKVLWENSLVKEDIQWISVSELKNTNSDAARKYNVSRIPANYLLDKEGNIVGKDLYGSLLEERLRELL